MVPFITVREYSLENNEDSEIRWGWGLVIDVWNSKILLFQLDLTIDYLKNENCRLQVMDWKINSK